ncbi:MAG TPA: PPOX class F420-dependent oxidoreductase [Nitrososphaeraceae archaeon]|jgi:PPOX class probable F420-dependent enzyme|nr:PPOX class F420-dependent oxidoreductase [Nitrososphaeraceae archaeon]
MSQSKENNNQITEPIAKLIEGKNFAFIATLMKDGAPQATPTWIDIDNRKTLLINTAEGRQKQKNITRDPRVAISIIEHNNPYHMVMIRGRVVEQTNTGADEHIDKLAKKYLGLEKYPMRSPQEKRIILKIKPEKVFYQPPR